MYLGHSNKRAVKGASCCASGQGSNPAYSSSFLDCENVRKTAADSENVRKVAAVDRENVRKAAAYSENVRKAAAVDRENVRKPAAATAAKKGR